MKESAMTLSGLLVVAVIICLPITVIAYWAEYDEAEYAFGQDSHRGQFPWQVALTRNGILICGGSIIDRAWVLTAAQCVYRKDSVGVVVGALLQREFTPFMTHRSSEIVVHDQYLRETGESSFVINDIALVKLCSPLEFSDTIRPIKLPTQFHTTQMFDEEIVVASGWGRPAKSSRSNYCVTSILQFVELNVEDLDVCIKDNFICARQDEENAFFGDTGGPIVWKDEDNIFRQIGVFSEADVIDGEYSDQSDILGMYTSVPHHLDWIGAMTGIKIEE